MMIAHVVMLLYKMLSAVAFGQIRHELWISHLRFSPMEGYRELAISSPRDCDGHSVQAAPLKQQGGRTSEKKRDKQEVDRRGRDERSRLHSKTFSSYIPREVPPFLRLLHTWSQLPRHIPSLPVSKLRLCATAVCANCLFIIFFYRAVNCSKTRHRLEVIKNNMYFDTQYNCLSCKPCI